jgi:hypothetical protein
MKRNMMILFFALLTATVMAQEWAWVSDVQTNIPDARCFDWTDRLGDRTDFIEAKLPVPSQLPALIHCPSGKVVVRPADADQAKDSIRADLRARIGVSDYTNAITKAAAVTGGGKSLQGIKNAGKNIPTSKERDYYMAAVDALIARVEMLEALLRERGLPVPAQTGVDQQ